MKNKKYFCYEIYKNLAVWSHNGKLAYNPCSFFNGFIKESIEFDLNQVWNGPERDELKKCVENDIPISGCQNDGKPEHAAWLSLDSLANSIDWIIHHPENIPILAIQANV